LRIKTTCHDLVLVRLDPCTTAINDAGRLYLAASVQYGSAATVPRPSKRRLGGRHPCTRARNNNVPAGKWYRIGKRKLSVFPARNRTRFRCGCQTLAAVSPVRGVVLGCESRRNICFAKAQSGQPSKDPSLLSFVTSVVVRGCSDKACDWRCAADFGQQQGIVRYCLSSRGIVHPSLHRLGAIIPRRAAAEHASCLQIGPWCPAIRQLNKVSQPSSPPNPMPSA
jgi:hypothetical protein